MTAAAEALERAQFYLALAGAHAGRLARMLTLGVDEHGMLALLALPYSRHLLAQALRDAADWCEAVGVQQGDIRWTAPVALIHNASGRVWSVRDPRVYAQIQTLMERMRSTVITLAERSTSRAIGVRLS